MHHSRNGESDADDASGSISIKDAIECHLSLCAGKVGKAVPISPLPPAGLPPSPSVSKWAFIDQSSVLSQSHSLRIIAPIKKEEATSALKG